MLDHRARSTQGTDTAHATWIHALLLAVYGLMIFGLALPRPANAHKSSDAYWQLAVNGTDIEERLDVALRDLDRDLGLDTDGDRRMTWGELRPQWDPLSTWIHPQARFEPNAGVQCQVMSTRPAQFETHSDGGYAVLSRQWKCNTPPNALSLDYRLFATTDPQHRGIVKLSTNGSLQTAVLGPSQSRTTWLVQPTLAAAEHPSSSTAPDPAPAPQGAWAFLQEGIHHILIGTDHILFLIALLLPAVLVRTPPRFVGGTEIPGLIHARWQAAPAWPPVLRRILGIVTAFTLAHSITLALAVWDVIQPPSRWVESIIAASVAFAALNNLRPIVEDRRWLLTFGFGLVHGFGFAGALKDLSLGDTLLATSLLSFNAGVELGQIAIVALFIPLAWALRRRPGYVRWVLNTGSFAIAALALLWVVERVAE